MNKTTHDMNTQKNKKSDWQRLMRNIILLAAMLLGGMTAWATDYVITYTSGGTTYYIGMNGSNQLVAKTVPDATCVWTAINRNNNNENSLSTTSGDNNRRRLRNKNNTSYFLNASVSRSGSMWSGYTYTWNITASTTGSQYWYGAEGSSLYHTDNSYSQGNGYLHNSGSSVTISTSSSNAFVPYAVTVTTVSSTSTGVTINSGADILTATGNSNYTTQSAAYRIGYTNYKYNNNTNHYFDANGNSFTGTPAAASISYLWSLTPNDYATVSGTTTTGTVNVSSLPETDITLTLTVTATATGGTPAAPANTTFTDSKQITIQGTKPSAPIISVSGTNVTMSTTAAGTTTIRYTLDGTTPTATSGTVYSGAIDLSSSTSSPVTIKAVTVRNGNASDVSEQTVTLTLPEPTITVNGGAGTATISSISGATIYYTTDGTTPTTLSSQYSATLTGLSMMQTIKAIAVKSGWNNSPVASATVTIPSGISGGTVTLFDYEDHTWTYYSGVDASVDGGNYNTNYVGKLYSPNPRNVKITYKANGGAVSISESETTFVYYKTLEEGTTAGQYPYQVISNPFSKRPNDKGFGGWKIKEGADYISGYADEATLPLDAEIVFTNLPYPSVNCTSAEIELEATWVNLNNSTKLTSSSTYTYSVTGGTYETNILILACNFSGTITASSPVTIMMVEPDGSTDYRGSYTFTGNITPNNDGVTKIEFTKWQSTNTVNAGYRHLWIGRGMTTTSGNRCANLITGTNSTTSVTSPQYSIKVESGVYQYFDFYKGHSTYTGGTDNTGFTVSGDAANAKITMGNDYDRAKGANGTLQFSYGPMFGYSGSFSSTGNRDNTHTLDLVVKSGTIGSTFFIENTNTANYLQGGAGYCMYLSSAGSQTNVGTRNVVIEGGDICSIGGGIDSYNNAPSNSNTPSTTTNYNRLSFNLRIKGGTIHGNVYGGAAKSPSGGNRVMVMTGGQVKGWFAAGCNGTDNDGGQNYGISYVYIGGKGKVDSEGLTKTLGYANGGNVYAAGAGRTGATTCGEMTFGSNLVIADQSKIERGAYGGGNYGYALASTNIYITGGTNNGDDGTVSNVTTKGGVFGGANQQDGPGINIYMTGGTMEGGVYGGCNTQGTISNNVTMQINGGQVGTSSASANIHGGGYGSATVVSGNVEITLGTSGQTTDGVTVYGDVYGGSALGYVNGTSANTTYHTYVTLNKGTINGSLYGGGLGDGSTAANVYGPVQVKVYGGSVRKTDANGANGSGGVYGANNVNGAPQRSVTVDIYGTDPAPSANEYALYAVYGGGNAADYTYGNGYPKVTVHNCNNSIEYVYGGGNAAAVKATDVKIYGGNTIGTVFGGGNGTVTPANVSGNTSVNIYGGTIGKVFGGSNSQGTIGGTISVNVEKTGSCEMHIGEVYGGGNLAASAAGSITIGCTGGSGEGIGDLYGGANQANISGDINLSISGGSINRVFGGNNVTGTVSGGIGVTVNWKTTNPCGYNYIGEVFGGGNLAQYTIPNNKTLTVNILNGTVSGNVYGGGKGDPNDHTKGQVTGNPVVTIGDNVNGHTAVVTGDVYGGGDAGNVVGTPQVNVINKCNTTIGNVYGGGNAADVNGTDVNIDGGTISGMVFGGGHGDKNSNPQKQADVNGNVAVDITGGTINKVFGGSNSKGNITGSVAVNIAKGNSSCEMHITEVYGGGNEAAGNAGTITIGCTGDYTNNGEGITDVYGGANAADINNNIALTIQGGHINRVFGGNNASGSISGTITVNVVWSGSCTDNYLYDVFGGGNRAAYTGNPTVNIKNGTVSHNVYGGGLGSSAKVTGNPVVTIGDANASHYAIVTGDVYGGGDAAPVTGNPVVTYNDNNASSQVGNLYGGGNAAAVTGSTAVNMTSGTVNSSIYGGGNAAGVSNTASVTMNGGLVTSAVFGGCNSNGTVTGDITLNINAGTIGTSGTSSTANVLFGGGYGENTNTSANVTVNVGPTTGTAGPTIYGAVYGGSALGQVSASNKTTKVNINNGHVYGDVYGGGLGNNAHAAAVSGNVEVNIGTSTQATNGVVIDGYVFGCNNTNGSPVGTVTVNVNRTAHTSGTDNNSVPSSGISSVRDMNAQWYKTSPDTGSLNGYYALKGVYGGGNLANKTSTTAVEVNINKCDNSVKYVYGGGKAADLAGSTSVTINGGHIYQVYGGGDGSAENTEANIGGDATTTIKGGYMHYVFGGSNTSGTISGDINVSIEAASGEGVCNPPIVGSFFSATNKAPFGNDIEVTITDCGFQIGDFYGGANQAAVTGDITLNIYGGTYENIFGGSNAADVIGNVTLNFYGGTVGNLFGGNNSKGQITGNIIVNVEQKNTYCSEFSIGSVYGGGNEARYGCNNDDSLHGNYPVVNIKHTGTGLISNDVFGGGLGSGAGVWGNPQVNVGGSDANIVNIGRNVFGGGNAAPVTGTTKVTVQNKARVSGNVFGGGNAAAVSSDTEVQLKDRARVYGNVYGGGNQGEVGGNTKVIVNGVTVSE